MPGKALDVKPNIRFKRTAMQDTLKPVCDRVLEQFSLPDVRLSCWFDDANNEDWMWQEHGLVFRGLATPVIGSGTWPDHIESGLCDGSGEFTSDFIIYLPGKTCLGCQTLFIIVLAHDLQHFVQWATAQAIYTANTVLFDNRTQVDPTKDWKAWDFPFEREAYIVSRQIGESILGTNELREFVDSQVEHKDEWSVFMSLTPPYDLWGETIKLVEAYRSALIARQEAPGYRWRDEIDFSKPRWWE